MDASRFDDLTRALADRKSRRALLFRGTIGLGALLGIARTTPVLARKGSGSGHDDDDEDHGNDKDHDDNGGHGHHGNKHDKKDHDNKGKNQGKDDGQGEIAACRGEGHPCEGNQECCAGLICNSGGPGSANRCNVADDDECVDCQPAEPSVPANDVTPVADEMTLTGTVEVRVATCPIAKPPTGVEYDWRANCLDPLSGADFDLKSIDPAADVDLAGTTTPNGEIRFERLEPDAYALTRTDGNWCFAESDDVNARGEVIVEAGKVTTVWIFVCTVLGGS
jgi:hypothetical protein